MEKFIEMGLPILGSICSIIFGIVLNKYRIKLNLDSIDKDIIASLEVGISHTYQTFVKGVKQKIGGDGKLSKTEARDAVEMAIKSAARELSGPSLKAFNKWGLPKAQSLIEKLINKAKSK